MYINENLLAKAQEQADTASCVDALNKQILGLIQSSSCDALWTTREVASYLRRSEKWVNLRSKDMDFPRSINLSGKAKPTPTGKAGRNGSPERLWRSKDIKQWVNNLADQ